MLNKKLLVILFSGKAGVGKTTSAMLLKVLLENKYVVRRASFAESLKDIAFQMGWNGEKDKKGRKLLQDIGYVGREYNKNVWVSKTLNNALSDPFPPDIIIIDDWRFPNEIDFIKQDLLYKPISIRIYAPNREILKNTPEYNDVSETSLPEYTKESLEYASNNFYNFIIDNSDNMEELNKKLEKIYSELLKLGEQSE
jgi:dephospho-CoA kinase